MAGLLTPILEEVQTALRATLNTEKDSLDSTLVDVASAAIKIEFPGGIMEDDVWVSIFPSGEVNPIQESNRTDDLPWGVGVEILVTGDGSEALIKAVDVYASAMIKSIVKHGDDWSLGGTSDKVEIVSINPESFFGRNEGEIIAGYFIQWEFRKEYDLTS